jgi:molybdate transport system regulatory protein
MFNGNEKWSLRLRVWVESNGVKILGPGRVELLELIDRHRSITAAAKQMNMSYRRAWQLVQAINDAAGEPFVVATTGGTGGGGTALTPRGREAIVEYRRLIEQVTQAAERISHKQ